MSVSSRTFGVEIECGHPELEYDEVQDRLYDAGWDLEVDRDGSGIEVRTEVLKGEKGYKSLTDLMNFLNKLGCYVSRADGMHVHIGAKGFAYDNEALRVIGELWLRNQRIVGRMCSEHRSGRGAYNAPLTREALNGLGTCRHPDHHWYERVPAKECKSKAHAEGGYKEFGYRANINFENLNGYGTIEFRIHEGCLDPVKAVAWVKFCQKFVDYAAKKKEVRTCVSKSALLRALDVPPDVIRVLSKRQPQMPERGVRVFAVRA